MTRAAAFTKAELARYRAYFESVGEKLAGVEKFADGRSRLLTASQVKGAASPQEDGVNEWDEVLRPQ